MANKQKKEVKIEIGGEEKVLRFTLTALAEMEDVLNTPLHKLMDLEMGLKTVQVMLWAGLLHQDPDLDVKAVGHMIDLDDLEYIQEKIGEAFAGVAEKN